MRLFNTAFSAVLLFAGAGPSFAEYPDRAIQIVVPYTPGGTVDLLARALGPRLTALGDSRSLSSTGPVPAAALAPNLWRSRCLTATRCSYPPIHR